MYSIRNFETKIASVKFLSLEVHFLIEKLQNNWASKLGSLEGTGDPDFTPTGSYCREWGLACVGSAWFWLRVREAKIMARLLKLSGYPTSKAHQISQGRQANCKAVRVP